MKSTAWLSHQQAPALEPLFRAGLVLYQQWMSTLDDTCEGRSKSVQPLTVEVEVAKAKAKTAKDKAIVAAYEKAATELFLVASMFDTYCRQATTIAEMEARSERRERAQSIGVPPDPHPELTKQLASQKGRGVAWDKVRPR